MADKRLFKFSKIIQQSHVKSMSEASNFQEWKGLTPNQFDFLYQVSAQMINYIFHDKLFLSDNGEIRADISDKDMATLKWVFSLLILQATNHFTPFDFFNYDITDGVDGANTSIKKYQPETLMEMVLQPIPMWIESMSIYQAIVQDNIALLLYDDPTMFLTIEEWGKWIEKTYIPLSLQVAQNKKDIEEMTAGGVSQTEFDKHVKEASDSYNALVKDTNEKFQLTFDHVVANEKEIRILHDEKADKENVYTKDETDGKDKILADRIDANEIVDKKQETKIKLLEGASVSKSNGLVLSFHLEQQKITGAATMTTETFQTKDKDILYQSTTSKHIVKEGNMDANIVISGTFNTDETIEDIFSIQLIQDGVYSEKALITSKGVQKQFFFKTIKLSDDNQHMYQFHMKTTKGSYTISDLKLIFAVVQQGSGSGVEFDWKPYIDDNDKILQDQIDKKANSELMTTNFGIVQGYVQGNMDDIEELKTKDITLQENIDRKLDIELLDIIGENIFIKDGFVYHLRRMLFHKPDLYGVYEYINMEIVHQTKRNGITKTFFAVQESDLSAQYYGRYSNSGDIATKWNIEGGLFLSERANKKNDLLSDRELIKKMITGRHILEEKSTKFRKMFNEVEKEVKNERK